MTRPTDAIVTGFTKNGELCRRAFAPLLELRQQGIIRNIRYVTWDSAEIDELVAPVAALDGIQITRVKQPHATGNRNQRGIVYQTRNIETAFAQVTERDALLVKLRPDFVFRGDFLKGKLRDFDRLCATTAKSHIAGIRMPGAPFKRKIWIPWADANQPFFFEDAAFIGLKSDLAKLLEGDLERRLPLLEDLSCGSLVHVLRFATAFLPRYPIFERYIRAYGAFINNIDYRLELLPLLLQDGFFWHLLIAHAWIVHTAFHVDSGESGDLAFYSNTINTGTDWRDLADLNLATPYDKVDYWREGTKAGSAALPALSRVYGRLVDDAWPRALFTAKMTDMPPQMLGRVARGVTLYPTGYLSEIENTFYAKLAAFHHQHSPEKKAA